MIIPKGKKFQFRAIEWEEHNKMNNWKAIADKQKKAGSLTDAKQSLKNAKSSMGNAYQAIPDFGYMGNSYLGQDVSLSVSANFSKPLEGILGKIPHTIDLIYQAKNGVSLNNARFTHLKYWTGTDAPEISVNLIFETQIDSYYDVYRPVMNLVRLSLPKETELGFYKSPVPTVKLIAKEGANFLKGVAGGLTDIMGKATTTEGKNLEKVRNSKLNNVAGKVDKYASTIEKTGFQTNLYIGNNFKFRNIIIKNVSPTFSSELAYAPIHFLNGSTDINDGLPAWFNPYTMGELVTKGYAQTVCAIAAQVNNGVQTVGNLLKSLPGPVREWTLNNIKDIPSFPIRAEVNMTFELQFPLTRNREANGNSISSVFRPEGYQRLY